MDFSALVAQCVPPNVSPQTMHAVMHVESGGKPHAIGYKLIRKSDRRVFRLQSQPANQQEAVQWARWLTDNGYEFDAGAAQIHSTNFGRYGLSLEAAFDACTSINTGGKILLDCYAEAIPKFRNEQVAVRAAVSCYQSGNFKTGFNTGYVQKVVNTAILRIPTERTR
jgi:type IV secretion system protein VirB1